MVANLGKLPQDLGNFNFVKSFGENLKIFVIKLSNFLVLGKDLFFDDEPKVRKFVISLLTKIGEFVVCVW